jgi:hypothetical protein
MTRTLTALCLVSLVGSLHGQSLADAAKKAEEKRAATAGQAGTTKVYTQKDVEALPPDVMLTSSEAPDTPQSAAAPSEPAPVDKWGQVKDEAYWKGRMAPLRAQLEDTRRTLAAARTDLQKLEFHMLMPSQWNSLGYEWGRLTDRVTMLEGMVRNAQKRIDDLEEEARVARVLPGWLR